MRRYFDVRLISAESDHLIERDWRVYSIGAELPLLAADPAHQSGRNRF